MLKVKLTHVNMHDESLGFVEGGIIEGRISGNLFVADHLGHVFLRSQYELIEPQKDELVLVKDGDDHTWEARYFSHLEKDLFYCFKYSQSSKETNEVESWKVLQRIKLVD